MDQETVFTVASVIAASAASAASLGWWLSTRFREIEASVETKHEQYLERFRRISVALAELAQHSDDGAGAGGRNLQHSRNHHRAIFCQSGHDGLHYFVYVGRLGLGNQDCLGNHDAVCIARHFFQS